MFTFFQILFRFSTTVTILHKTLRYPNYNCLSNSAAMAYSPEYIGDAPKLLPELKHTFYFLRHMVKPIGTRADMPRVVATSPLTRLAKIKPRLSNPLSPTYPSNLSRPRLLGARRRPRDWQLPGLTSTSFLLRA